MTSKHEPEFARIIGELAGHASMCWEPKPEGVFVPEEANAAVEAAMDELRKKFIIIPRWIVPPRQ